MSRKPRRKGVNAKGRNTGEGQYMPLPYNLTKSVAFRHLSGNALKVFIELRSRFNGVNNGRLSLSYQDAADLLGMSKSSVKRAFDELVEKGFLKRRREGQWYGRLAAEYILTTEKHDGHLATHDWKRWTGPSRGKSKPSVRVRDAKASRAPGGYRSAASVYQHGTRPSGFRVIDGSV
ncbi:helix-turn-helix domain-containing protein [Hyphomonas sp.]|uniref:helix-turn-helix domain-containing protein n=1 Tax=Hyphomonas sp. TaxID=87 RepID=UPI000C4B0B8F|nr:helix-turn-helix domain-containing protein [Hyphomonas sp.]MAB11847.1 hypothetical protein [Hyphomonas sp.]MAU68436.1 hypothetical protein [Hyphomonas sp.]MBM58392.1 hypothetical protein [Hyphomonas sp.]